MTYKIDLLHRTERDCRVLYCAAVPNISSVTVGETYLCHFLSFLIEKLWFTVLCIQMQSLGWKFGMWDITTVNLKSHPEIKINGPYFNWKLQLLWASEKSKMVVSLIEFPLEFLLPELESVSIFIFVSKYHVSIFLTIYLAGKIPFSQTNSWNKPENWFQTFEARAWKYVIYEPSMKVPKNAWLKSVSVAIWYKAWWNSVLIVHLYHFQSSDIITILRYYR